MGKEKRVSDFELPDLHFSSNASSVSSGESTPICSDSAVDNQTMKSPKTQASVSHHHHHHHQHQSLSLPLPSKRSLPFYRHHYSRKASNSRARPSTSQKGRSMLLKERVPLRLDSIFNTEPPQQLERTNETPGGVDQSKWSSSSYLFSGRKEMMCSICKRLLRPKPYCFGNPVSFTQLCAVAVLGCGHAYHAECLEQETRFEDRTDPPCPFCVDSFSKSN